MLGRKAGVLSGIDLYYTQQINISTMLWKNSEYRTGVISRTFGHFVFYVGIMEEKADFESLCDYPIQENHMVGNYIHVCLVLIISFFVVLFDITKEISSSLVFACFGKNELIGFSLVSFGLLGLLLSYYYFFLLFFSSLIRFLLKLLVLWKFSFEFMYNLSQGYKMMHQVLFSCIFVDLWLRSCNLLFTSLTKACYLFGMSL